MKTLAVESKPIPITPTTKKDLIAFLKKYQISWKHWNLKTINDLWQEVSDGTFTLAVQNDRLIKTKDLVVVDVWYSLPTNRVRLIEDTRLFAGGGLFHLDTAGIRYKKKAGETLLETAIRGTCHDLQIKDSKGLTIKQISDRPRREDHPSQYFGGIISRTNKYFFLCDLPPQYYTIDGYQSVEENRMVRYSWRIG
ncbi:MAG: hypothetical protein KBC98_00305 [Candidatus Pacebacteria bacterium]|nr:hypothetical protein [Candidatus Paceibacterota bacterium]